MSGDPFGDAARELASAAKSAAAGEPTLYYVDDKVVDLTSPHFNEDLDEFRGWELPEPEDGGAETDDVMAMVAAAAMADHASHVAGEPIEGAPTEFDFENDIDLSDVTFEDAQAAVEEAVGAWDDLSEEEQALTLWLDGKIKATQTEFVVQEHQRAREEATEEYNEAVVAEMVKLGQQGYDLDTLGRLIEKHGGDDSDPDTLDAVFAALGEIGPAEKDLEGMIGQTLRERRALAS